ncbi:hypothetical protein SLS62_004987 [Diatrype stigma]|uniref:Cytidyltransferase-like domain-containing protein n=1 Tax=Diatrype stigma TaxID=117547 RepID=A0AAN9V3X7_9PEZI
MSSAASGATPGPKSDPPSLILLPPPPRPANRSTLNAAYRPPLEAAISRLRNNDDKEGATLIVALASPFLTGQRLQHQTLSWPEAQTLIAGLYGIISTICARLSLPSEVHAGPGSVDVRVVLVDHDPSRQYKDGSRPAIETNNTVIVDLATFASAYHPWKYIFHVNNEAGYSLLTTYLRIFEGVQKQTALRQDQLVVVEGGIAMSVRPSDPAHFAPQTNTYSTVCLGGTFDHLHPGHKLLLHAAVLLLDVPEKGAKRPCRFIIGVTGDELLKRKKYAEFVQSWNERVHNVIEFLSTVLHVPTKEGWKRNELPITRWTDDEAIAHFRDGTIEVQCVVLQDTFGPTTATEDMDVLVVSGETRSGGQAVNAKRQERGWHPLEVFEVDVLDAGEEEEKGGQVTTTGVGDNNKEPTKSQDFATKISSTAIRKQKAEATAAAAAAATPAIATSTPA